MREGMYLGRPPVDIGRSRARAVLATMLRGGTSYGAAAGTGAPLSMPALQPNLPTSAGSNPNAAPRIAPVELYPLSPSLFKLDLRRRFGVR